MTVLVKFQIEIRFSIELHENSKLSMTSCPPSSGKYHGPLSAIKSDKLKKKYRHQELSEIIRARLKAQDPASCRVLSPIV